MPIYRETTPDGRRWRTATDVPFRMHVTCAPGECSMCWREEPEPAATVQISGFTTSLSIITDETEETVSEVDNMTAARFRHPAGRPLGREITHPNARCSECGQSPQSGRPLEYADGGPDFERHLLLCPSCITAYPVCEDTGLRNYSVRVESDEDNALAVRFFSHSYATQGYLFARDGLWFMDANHYRHWRARTTPALPPVFQYHEQNPIRLHGWPEETAEHELCFGVELEMEHKRDTAQGQAALASALGGREGHLTGVAGQYILARDGSLNQTGVELITSPYTLDYHLRAFGWETLLESVKGIGKSGKGTDRCGMHVHMNRAAISALTLGKMLVFANHPDNTVLIERIAQRRTDFARRRIKKTVEGKLLVSDKYECLHITQATIECRLFRGNLRPERVLKNIEFCHALVSYCSVAGIRECQGFQGFIDWLGVNRGTYKNLVRFLAPHYGYKLTREDKSEDM